MGSGVSRRREKQGVHQTEHSRVCANPQRQNNHRCNSESRRLAELAQSKLKIVHVIVLAIIRAAERPSDRFA